MTNNKNKQQPIIVRPLQVGDEGTVARIWREGLSQTVESSRWYMRPFLHRMMENCADAAMKDDGDLGPNGCNLLKTYSNHTNDRIMLVAEGESGVLGAVGVQRGGQLGAGAQEDEKEVTIWRMSVCQSARRRGVGLALMEAAQDHARNQWGCTKMKLVTANPVAACFYVNKIGMEPPNWKTFYTWYTKEL